MSKKIFNPVVYVCLMINLALTACSEPEPNFNNVQLFEPVRHISEFELISSEAENLTLDSLKSNWSIVFLGYTYCPDICPTTLSDLARVYPTIKQSVPNAQVIFISADPKRDNKKQITEYIHFFNPDFVAATAQHKQLLPFTRELGLVYSMGGEGSNYLVNHSASLVIVNPEGQLVARVKPDMSQQPAKIDYQQLVSLMDYLSSKS